MSEIKINNIPVITENNGSVELTTGAANIGNNALVVNSSGNVGVGISSPEAKFHVSADGFNGGHGIFQSTNSGNSITIRGVNGAGINDSAFVLFEDGTASRNAFIGLTGDAAGEGALRFATGGLAERMRIDSSGYVTKPYQPAFEARTYEDETNGVSSYGYYPSEGQFDVVTPYVNVTNIGNHFNAQTNRFTVPISGMYVIGFNFYFSPASGNYVGGVINISTGRFIYAFSSTGSDVNATYSTCIYLNKNDWVRFLTYCADANSRLFYSSTVYGYFLG